MKIKLYHATSSKNYDAIKKDGFLRPGYLTSCPEQVQYYSECAAEEDNSIPVILTVEIDTQYLLADTASYNEPLSYILKENNYSEDDWHEAIKDNSIIYPNKNQWHISLETVKCVKNIGNIPLEDIAYDGSLNEKDEENILLAIKNEYLKAKKNKP